jgi:Spy/CpxP family protein refolding chaperone
MPTVRAILSLLMITFALVLPAPPAAAEAAPGWLDELGLSGDQRAKIQEIHARRAAAIEPLRAEKQRLHDELKRLMAGAAPADEARALHLRIQEVKRQLGAGGFETLLEIRALLTPQQRSLFVERMHLRGPH